MKVLMLNGSPRPEGNTAIVLWEMGQISQAEGAETELVQVGNRDIRGCVACNGCAKLGRRVFDRVYSPVIVEIQNFRRQHRTLCDAGGMAATGNPDQSHIFLSTKRQSF